MIVLVLVAVSAIDLLSFGFVVVAEPALARYDVGPIGLVAAVLGPLGAMAWKFGGLAVVLAALAIAQERHPVAVQRVLMVALVAATVGAVGNVVAVGQLLAAGWQPY